MLLRSEADVQEFLDAVSQCGGDEAAAARIVNRPGTSEHQLGLCADITDKYYEVKTRDLEKPALYQWMYAHCQEYGFILRYPKDAEAVEQQLAAVAPCLIFCKSCHNKSSLF